MAGWAQEEVTFEDVAVYLSRAEWEAMAEEQRQLYRRVMLDNYQLLTSLGYPGPKPDVLYRIERGEEPWVCAPQSPRVRWDGPGSPSPGHDEASRCLEDCPSGWWPEAVGRRVEEEERTETSQPGGRCRHWRLRSRRLLNKLRGLGNGPEPPSEAAGGKTRLLGSQDQAPKTFQPAKEGEAENNKREVEADVSQARGLMPHPVVEQQNHPADPQERPCGGPGRVEVQRNLPRSQRTSEEVTSPQGNVEPLASWLLESVFRDHSYCVRRERWPPCRAPRPLQEHDYCRSNEAGDLVLQDHEYCHGWRLPGWVGAQHVLPLNRKARAALCRLRDKENLSIIRIIKRAKRRVWNHKPSTKRFPFPQGACPPEPALPPAKAASDSVKGPCQAVCPRSEVTSPVGTWQALGAPGTPFEAMAPPSNPAVEVKKGKTPPEVSTLRQEQNVEPLRSCNLKEKAKGDKLHQANPVSLQDAYKMVMRTVDYVLDSVRQSLERGGYPLCEEMWPLAIQLHR